MRVPRHADVWTVAAVAGVAAFAWALVRGGSVEPADEGRRGRGARSAQVTPPPSDPEELEAWLERNPSRASAWLELGNKRFEQGREADARAAWLKAEALYEGHAAQNFGVFRSPSGGWYNFACVRARLGKAEEALAALERAVEAGWGNADGAMTDPDLESVRADPRFGKLVEKMQAGERTRIFTDG